MDVGKWADLLPKAMSDLSRLFPRGASCDVSGVPSVADDKDAEDGLHCPVKTVVDKVRGVVNVTEFEEEEEIQTELISKISSYAAALGTARYEDEQGTEAAGAQAGYVDDELESGTSDEGIICFLH